MTVMDRPGAGSPEGDDPEDPWEELTGNTPGVADVLSALCRAQTAQAEAMALIGEVFGGAGERISGEAAAGGALVQHWGPPPAPTTRGQWRGGERGFVTVDIDQEQGAEQASEESIGEDRAPVAGEVSLTNGSTVAGEGGGRDTTRSAAGDEADTEWSGTGGSLTDQMPVMGSRVPDMGRGAFVSVFRSVAKLAASTDRVRQVCAEMVFAGSDPFIDKPRRVCERLDEKSPQAAIKKYLLYSPKQVRDIKQVRTATMTGEGSSLSQLPAWLPVLSQTVTAAAVTLEQAEVIADLLVPLARRSTGVDPGALASVEEILVGHATGGRFGTPPDTVDFEDLLVGIYGMGMHPEELRRLGKELAALVDQDGPEPAYEDAVARRELRIKPGKRPGDPATLTATLTPEAYEQLTTLLASILDPATSATPISPETGEASDGAPDLPFTTQGCADESGFRFADEPPTLPQAQHDAFVSLMGQAAAQGPSQGGAPPRLILLARAEQVLKALDHTPGSAVDTQVTQAVAALAAAGRAGHLTDEAIKVINDLIDLLNTTGLTRADDADAALAADQADEDHARKDHSDADPAGAELAGAELADVDPADAEHGAGAADTDRARTDESADQRDPGDQGPSSTVPRPAFGASLFQDPRLLSSALLPATGETVPLSHLAEILCDAVVELVATEHGDFLNYSVSQHRTFTAAQRRVLLTTYTSCAVPDCHVPGLRCDAHHIHPASLNGPTSIDNGILLCRHHHRKLHQHRLELVPRQPGIPGLDAASP